MIDAVVFDFDGVILDTEQPWLAAWLQTFERCGVVADEDEMIRGIGTHFDAYELLVARATVPLPPEADVRKVKSEIERALHADLQILPGVDAWLAEAAAAGIPVGIASSSPSSWVLEHLERVGAVDAFVSVSCCDGDTPAKPAPDIYLAACDALGVMPHRALAVEDSANGIAAAKAAGLWCVAVPSPLTRRLDLSAADVRVESLADIALTEVIETVRARG